MPSLKKHPVGDYSSLPGTLPSANVPKDLDKASVASACLSQLGNTIQRDALSEDAIWRDTYAFTGTLRTFYGPRSITDTWDKLARIHKPHSFKLVPGAILVLNFGDPVEHSWLQAMFTFETEGELPATCSGFLGITPGSEGDWKIWTLRTMLENFKGLEDVDVPPLGATNGRSMNGLSPSNGVNGGHSEAEASFDVAVVGAGQAGISTAGRLNAMHISNVVLEGNDEIGGNWLSRYDSARLHLTKESSHLPFDRSFLDDDPELLGRTNLAEAYKRYVAKYGILSTTVEKASWSSAKQQWTIQATSHGEPKTIKARQLVLANGLALRTPSMPDIPDRSLFHGEVMHASKYKSAKKWKGLKGVVVGTANTAHDVAQDMVEAGLASVTMVQRNDTYVFPLSHIFKTFTRNLSPSLSKFSPFLHSVTP